MLRDGYKEVNLYAKIGTTILYKSPRGFVLRTPATLTGIRTFRPLRGPVLIPVVLRQAVSRLKASFRLLTACLRDL